MTKKRLCSIIILVFITLLYIATIILAFLDSPFSKSCLMAALFCTIVLPVMGYAFLLADRYIRSRWEEMQGDESE